MNIFITADLVYFSVNFSNLVILDSISVNNIFSWIWFTFSYFLCTHNICVLEKKKLTRLDSNSELSPVVLHFTFCFILKPPGNYPPHLHVKFDGQPRIWKNIYIHSGDSSLQLPALKDSIPNFLSVFPTSTSALWYLQSIRL